MPRSSFLRLGIVALATIAVVIVAGCGGGGDETASSTTTTSTSASSTSTSASTTSGSTSSAITTAATASQTTASSQASTTQAAAEPSPTEGPPDVEQLHSLFVTRIAYYADMTYNVTDAVVTNSTLETYNAADSKVGDGLYLVLHLTVKNELNSRPQQFALNYFHLEAEAMQREAMRVPGQPAFNVPAGAAINIKIAFEVTEAFDFDDAILVIAEPGTETAPLALGESSSESGYPVTIDIASGQQQVTSGNPCGTTMLVDTLGAESDLDARIDAPGLDGVIDGSRRAAEGERFIRIEMRATGDSGQCGGANVPDAIFRLEVDGVPRGAVNNVNEIARSGEAVDFTLLYRVPVDAKELTLLAGAPSGTVAEYPLTYEKLSP